MGTSNGSLCTEHDSPRIYTKASEDQTFGSCRVEYMDSMLTQTHEGSSTPVCVYIITQRVFGNQLQRKGGGCSRSLLSKGGGCSVEKGEYFH